MSPFPLPLSLGMPRPLMRSFEPACVPAGMSSFSTPSKVSTLTSQPRAACGYEISIGKKMDVGDPVQEDIEQFFEVAELEQVSYDCIEDLLAAMGYELKMKTQQNEENVKKGIDTTNLRVILNS